MTKGRTTLIFILAITLGIGATWLANQWIESRLTPVAFAQAETDSVVIAALEIPFGQKIEKAHLRLMDWPSKNMPKGAIQSLDMAEGKVVNQTILPGELVLESRIVEHIAGSTLSSIISQKMRAVTVRVNDVIGVAGFLLPGNHVDIIASRKTNQKTYTRTILEDLKVLAVDQTASPDKDKPVVVRAVTLEMQPKQAETLIKATQEGTVQLALRNPTDESRLATVKPAKAARGTSVVSNSVTVIRGTSVNVSRARF